MVTPLRIAHVSNEAFGLQTANGVQHMVHCLARAQADLGHTVVVFSRDDAAVNVLGPDAASMGSIPGRVAGSPPRSLRERFMSRYLEPRLAGDVLARRPDIVHFHSVHIPENVALGAHLRRAGIPYCVTIHGALFAAALRRNRWKKAAFSLLVERRYLNEARFIHALSPTEQQVIRNAGVVRPVIVAPNGLPPDSQVRASQPEVLFASSPRLRGRRVFMFIGRLDSWQKGLDLLVEAFAQARLQHAGLVLVGPDCRGSRDDLERRVRRLGIASDVVFMEPVFGQDLANLLAAADVFVHPSRWEGLSLSVLTAAAAGKPCVVTRDADPLGELERAGAAILVEPTMSSITAGFKRAAVLAPDELESMGARARRAAEAHFTWRAIAEKLALSYRSVAFPSTF